MNSRAVLVRLAHWLERNLAGLTRGMGLLAAVLLPLLMVMALWYAPTEREMGEVQRIFYIHVPSAYCGFIGFFIVAVCSGFYLATGHNTWDRVAWCAAETGMLFTTLVLITGPIWARPVWNTWWTWDPRLTTTLILWLIYAGYLVLRSDLVDISRVQTFAAVYGIVGFIDVPIVYMSIRWWRTIHPLLFKSDGFNITSEMHLTLRVGFAACLCLFFFLSGLRLMGRLMEDDLERVRA